MVGIEDSKSGGMWFVLHTREQCTVKTFIGGKPRQCTSETKCINGTKYRYQRSIGEIESIKTLELGGGY